jgi:uncharacterized RDD family membrane protein YckC
MGGPVISGVDAVIKDSGVQLYWGRRVAAFIIDAILVGIAFAVIAAILVIPSLIGSIMSGNILNLGAIFGATAYSFLNSVLLVLYCSLADSMYGTTLGKSVMGFKVTTLDGKSPAFVEALIRNVSKINWVLLILDVVIGLATQTDYKQKLTDKYARTIVLSRT